MCGEFFQDKYTHTKKKKKKKNKSSRNNNNNNNNNTKQLSPVKSRLLQGSILSPS